MSPSAVGKGDRRPSSLAVESDISSTGPLGGLGLQVTTEGPQRTGGVFALLLVTEQDPSRPPQSGAPLMSSTCLFIKNFSHRTNLIREAKKKKKKKTQKNNNKKQQQQQQQQKTEKKETAIIT